MVRIFRVLSLLGLSLAAAGAPLGARAAAPAILAKGARIGVLNLLDPEVTQFHGAKVLQDSFRKTYPVDWPVDGLLADAVRERLAQLGLVAVPLASTQELDRGRESCFLNGYFGKELPKDCVLPLQHLIGTTHVDAVIVLGPGLNDSRHAGSTRRKDLPEDLRGWAFVSGEGSAPDGKPLVLTMTELLLVVPTPAGPALSAHEWGGAYSVEWSSYTPPADLKAVTAEDFAQLKPLFAGLLARQTGRLLEGVQVKP